MMNYPNVRHSSRVSQLNDDGRPEILFELNTTWTAPETVPFPSQRVTKTVLTRFECYGNGKGTEIKEAGIVLANSLALTQEAREIITERYPGEWHTAAEAFLNKMDSLGMIAERCGSVTFDGTGTLAYHIGHPEVIIDFPTLCRGDRRGVLFSFTKDGLSEHVPKSYRA